MTSPMPPEDLRVDVGAIERSLSEIWRNQNQDEAVTRAALWNVIAHTGTIEEQEHAAEVLCAASEVVPQRTIVIRSDPRAEAELASWIGVNCHVISGDKQVCSEEIAIIAGGDHVDRVPPLMNSLLIPDMPVAVWWVGDLPHENEAYVQSMLDPADRLIIDSSAFDDPADLALLTNVAEQTTTAPADLNWVRLDEWRLAAASIFDAQEMRSRLRAIRRVRVVATASSESPAFGENVGALYFAAWLTVQSGQTEDAIDYQFEHRLHTRGGGVAFVELAFDDGSSATITRDRDRAVLTSTFDGVERTPEAVTRSLLNRPHELIARQLKQPEADRMLVKTLPVATRMAKRTMR